MNETFTLSPTAYAEAAAKEAALSLKQRQARARRKLKRMEKTRLDQRLLAKMTSGGEYAALCEVRDYCKSEQIDVPVWITWNIALHEYSQRKAQNI